MSNTMTRRDHAAHAAMQGMLAWGYLSASDAVVQRMATDAYRMADAMEAARGPVKDAKPKGAGYPDDFEAFWAAYPRKAGKGAAFAAWKKLLAAQRVKAKAAVGKYAEAVGKWPATDHQYVPHPSRWLNGHRFDDDPREWERVNPQVSEQRATAVSSEYKRGTGAYGD